MKNYSSQLINALNDEHQFCHVVDLQFTSGQLRLTDAAFDVVVDGNVYSGNGLIEEVESHRQEQALRVQEIQITFTNADQTILATLLNNEQRNRLATIRRVVLAAGTNDALGVVFSARFRISSYGCDGNNVQVTLRGAIADFEAVRGIVTTHESIRRFYPANTSFINSSSVNDKLTWGA